MEIYAELKITKEKNCKGCPQIDDCDNNEPINCLRRWNYMFTGSWD